MTVVLMKPNVQKQQDILTLIEYLHRKPDGTILSWTEIQQETGLEMTKLYGRSNIRRALRKMKRPYTAIIGTGIRLSCAENAMDIFRKKVSNIDGAVRVADKTQQELHKRHLEQMNPEDQRRMILAAGFFGTLRVFASEARRALVGKKT